MRLAIGLGRVAKYAGADGMLCMMAAYLPHSIYFSPVKPTTSLQR
jgi:hypothetical protein